MADLIRLTVIHQNRLYRECLSSILSANPRWSLTTVDPEESAELASALGKRPDVYLVDANLAGNRAFDLIREIRRTQQAAGVLVLVSCRSEERLLSCIEAGAHGCVLEESSLEELRDAINSVCDGQTYCGHEVARFIFSQIRTIANDAQWRSRPSSAKLTSRELEILELIAAGDSNKQIARKLAVSLYTIKNHVHNILKKLQVQSRFEAAAYARQRRLIGRPA